MLEFTAADGGEPDGQALIRRRAAREPFGVLSAEPERGYRGEPAGPTLRTPAVECAAPASAAADRADIPEVGAPSEGGGESLYRQREARRNPRHRGQLVERGGVRQRRAARSRPSLGPARLPGSLVTAAAPGHDECRPRNSPSSQLDWGLG
ncbi:hypothetical protein GCM10010387_46160 [Streptomyces inusitatus]|uniref:Uncharacterized protein n=1 Tax=Streptomyces inusitatus TaxID=68221 RepID=A0A918UYU7_9ACTN|nr:hypothetical protein GCM10010387_46160 [Streptomyces inusitatus]